MCVCALAVIVGIPPCSKMSLMKTQASEGDDVVGNQRSESRKKRHFLMKCYRVSLAIMQVFKGGHIASVGVH